jgi:hypothetical protein
MLFNRTMSATWSRNILSIKSFVSGSVSICLILICSISTVWSWTLSFTTKYLMSICLVASLDLLLLKKKTVNLLSQYIVSGLEMLSTVTEPPWKWGVCHLKIDRGILDEARMHKHTYKIYKDMIKVEIKLLQLCLEVIRYRSRRCFRRYNIRGSA